MNNNRNIIAAVSYITWIGFIASFILGDRTDRFEWHHLNQALVINLAEIIGGVLVVIPLLGTLLSIIISLGVFVLDVLGAVSAMGGSTQPLPLVGNIHLIG